MDSTLLTRQAMLAIGGSRQVLEEEGQRLFQIRYSLFFRRTVTNHLNVEAARDINTVFLDYLKVRSSILVS